MNSLLQNARRAVYRHVLYPAVVWARGEGELFSALEELDDLQWVDHEELQRRQRRWLKETLEYAAERVPLYRDRWSLETPVRTADAFETLAELPQLTKSDLQERSEALVAEDGPSRVSRKTTGGSTGQPVTVLKDRSAVARERAASWLGYGWFGVDMGDRGARFWGSPAELGRRRLRFAAADFAVNRVRFSAFSFSDEDLAKYWVTCLRVRPDYFYGYVSMLTEFARHLRDREHDGGRLGLKAVVTTSEALTSPQRELLETVFQAPVQNEYGCGELGPIAYECPEGGLHVMTENVVVEVLRDDGRPAEPGESGEVVVTDLNNRAMPLIRYRVGDRATVGRGCECGRGFPVLERVWGRAYDFVQDRDGRRYHGEYFMYLFEDLRDRGAAVGKFRVTQRSETDLEMEIVAPGELPPEYESFLRSRLDRDMPEMNVTVGRVASIDRSESGKTRVIRNPWLADDGDA